MVRRNSENQPPKSRPIGGQSLPRPKSPRCGKCLSGIKHPLRINQNLRDRLASQAFISIRSPDRAHKAILAATATEAR
jgi:hypothetical protein